MRGGGGQTLDEEEIEKWKREGEGGEDYEELEKEWEEMERWMRKGRKMW